MIKMGILICLSLIAFQDFKRRAIHWISFPVLLSFLIWEGSAHFTWKEMGTHLIVNTLILLIQWFALTVYFSLKQRQFIHIMDRFIGWGDALLFLSMAVYFPPLSFFLFLTFGLSCTLLISIFWAFFRHQKNLLIPLAGWISVVFIALDLFYQVMPGSYLFEEETLLGMLTPILT